jgi:hypothetical protein
MRVSDNIEEIGSGIFDGEIIHIVHPGEGFQSSGLIKLRWSDEGGNWYGRPNMGINGTDQNFTHQQGVDGDWGYYGNTAMQGKWGLRAVPATNKLYAAGLKLQDRVQGRSQTTNLVCWFSPWFYDYPADNSGRILFSNDKSAQAGFTWNGHADLGFAPSKENVGHGAVYRSSILDSAAVARLYSVGQYDDGILTSPYHTMTRAPGWDYVRLFVAEQPSGSVLGGVPTTTPFVPVKWWLYPTLYGFGGVGAGGAAAIYWEWRWASELAL